VQIPPLDPQLRDLRNAAFATWKVLGLPSPTALQYDVCDFLQGPGDRKIVLGYRGLAKSYITCLRTVHRHRLEVEDKGVDALSSLVLSAGKDFADTLTLFMQRLMREVPFYRCLLPGNGDLSSLAKFDVGPKAATKDPSVKSAGIFGQTVGSRAHDIVLDDVEVPNTAGTVGMREKLLFRVNGMVDLLPPEGGDITILGTPHFEESMYLKLAEQGYAIRIYPARYPDEDRLELLGDRLAPVIREAWTPELVGKPTDPDRYDQDSLDRKEVEKGRTAFAMQYQLDTTLSDREARPLRLSDLIVHDLDVDLAPKKLVWNSAHPVEDIPVWGLQGDRFNRPLPSAELSQLEPYTGSVMAIDPSGRGADLTGWAISKVLHGTVFIVDFGGYKEGFDDATLRGLAESAKQWKVNVIQVESNFGDGMFEELLKPHLTAVGHRCVIESERSSGQKERRICDTLEPLMNQHRLVIDTNALRRDAAPMAGVPEEKAMQHRLAYQMSRATRERGCLKHDDVLEAVSMAAGHWAQAMARTADEHIKKLYDDEMDEIVRNWNDPAPSPSNWMHNSLDTNRLR